MFSSTASTEAVLPAGLPKGTSLYCIVPVAQYLEQLHSTFQNAKRLGLFVGRDNNPLTQQNKEDLAQLYNAFGFYSDQWGRYLHIKERTISTRRAVRRSRRSKQVWTVPPPPLFRRWHCPLNSLTVQAQIKH